MKSTYTSFLALFAILILVGQGCIPQTQTDTPPEGTNTGTPVMNDDLSDDLMDDGNDSMSDDNDSMEDTEMMEEDADESKDNSNDGQDVSATGTYIEYSTTALANAADGDTILFFHADWCPTCRGLDEDIRASLDDIPAGVTILQTDYDAEKNLKKSI